MQKLSAEYARQNLVAGICVALLVISGCASPPNVVANANPNADFSQYETYGFFDPLATDQQGYESLLSSFLKVAVAQEMDQRGYAYSDSPDLLINFYALTKEKVRSRSVPTGAYYGYRDPFFYDPWVGYPAYETRIEQYTQGTLTIDVVDPKSKTLVWEGTATGRVTDEAIRNLEQSVDKAVSVIMADFPAR